ncbi:hypothetical protein F5Y18DRAFT_67482 [Xylariaceae sp. FL1019]|nr:hypothetical protein F5Y18DRAFT_67482 [Xylariaceae sp. FL1019]
MIRFWTRSIRFVVLNSRPSKRSTLRSLTLLFLKVLLLFVSGLPLEKSMNWDGYSRYTSRTTIPIPFTPQLYPFDCHFTSATYRVDLSMNFTNKSSMGPRLTNKTCGLDHGTVIYWCNISRSQPCMSRR